ncbi:olfactory receptor 52D1-like [Mauremys mutica]|uniref:olfactory receptor 52D1-like n=1 Tax=Mauremys mutica TaxID=74926 RepID=UPI001D13E416|nr:olfactory receptor 52D1-like [Mauremys mutica]
MRADNSGGGTLRTSEPDRHIEYPIMATFNLTPSNPSTFSLSGILGLEAAHIWISIPVSMSYIISLLGNATLLFIVGKEQTLHKPMYLLLSMLALTDITTFSFTQSAVLVTMAFDRYVAICNPLRYTTILTNARVATLGLVGLIRSALFILPLPLILSRLPFCANRIIHQTHCEHMAVAKISCGNITVSRMYSLAIAFVVSGIDLMLIAISYGLIIRAILKMSSKKSHQKALNTCTAHICVMLTTYSPGLFTNLTHRSAPSPTPPVTRPFHEFQPTRSNAAF